jgi:hypothetical protein
MDSKRRLPTDKIVMLLVLTLAIVILAADGMVHPERRYLSLLFVSLGFLGTYRLYTKWRNT